MFHLYNNLIADEQLHDVSPSEFLSLISNAEYVCTDSFHCVIFSYVYQKDFFVFDRNDSKQNSRLDTLLNIFNLTNRRKSKDSVIENNILDRIDYSKIDITKHQKISFQFLQNALNNK